MSLLWLSLFTDVWSGWITEPQAVIERGMKLAIRALSIDDRDNFAHFTMGVATACASDMRHGAKPSSCSGTLQRLKVS